MHAGLNIDALRAELAPLDLKIIGVESQAIDRTDYLRHPSRGRTLDDASRRTLIDHAAVAGACDVALILADGLSATATQSHGPGLAKLIVDGLRTAGHTLGPIVIARQARVALQDDIGQALRARSAIILLGERPGLGSADSLGAYYVFGPHVGRNDADRNCVSNIRPAGLPLSRAAATILYLIDASFRRQLSGVALKDERLPEIAPARMKKRMH